MTRTAPNTDDRQRVRDASDIVTIVGEHVSLKAKGREFVGLCPFHDDHKPSMSVVPTKQIFHCFSCGAGGDVFSFIQKYHAMGFREALEHLAGRAGIELSRARPAAADESQGPTRQQIVNANLTATDYFRAILSHPDHGLAARDIIDRRGISPDMVEAFQLGASADRWDGLGMTINAKGLDQAVFTAAGLLKHRSDGSTYDAMRNRLIFPIHDQIGRVIAFGGRVINDDDEPKYLNSPETPLFNKSASLYGLHQAARSIQREQTAIVVEGYTDVIACHQAGITNVVGTLGTALTPDHAAKLRHLCDTVILLFDGDEAGQRAADRAVEVFFNQPVDVRIATLTGTDAKDPDELLSTPEGPARFAKLIDDAIDVLEFRFARISDQLAGAGLSARTRLVEQELARLAQLGLADQKPMRRRLIIRQIANIVRIDERIIQQMIPAGRFARPGTTEESPTTSRPTTNPADAVIGCLLSDGSLRLRLTGQHRSLLEAAAYGSPMTSAVAESVRSLIDRGTDPELQPVLDELAAGPEPDRAADLCSHATALQQRISTETADHPGRLGDYLADCLRHMERDELTARPDTDPTDESMATIEARFERIRRAHKDYGGNPKVRIGGQASP